MARRRPGRSGDDRGPQSALGEGPAIAWAFLDVGNVLLDEDPLGFFVFSRHVEAVRRVRPDRSFADLLAEREARAWAGSAWPVYEVASAYLGEAGCAEVWAALEPEVRGRFSALCPPVVGAPEVVDRLSRRFRLGLIANQGRECRAHLESLGLLDRFAVVALSEEEGLSKPHPGLFLRAIERAGARPSECLMVGDRLDNDIAPAEDLGMATAWVRWPRRSAKGWAPDDPHGRAYLASIERSSDRSAALLGHVRPSLVVDEFGDLDALAL